MKIKPLNYSNHYYNQYTIAFNPIQQNIQRTPFKDNLYTITFGGRDKNPNQILMLSSECTPYSDSGGLASITCDRTKAFMDKYKSKHKDLRIIIPIYNANENGPKMLNGAPIIEHPNKLDPKTGLPLRFELEDTGIKERFKYGVKETEAKLFKVKNPVNGVPTYAVFSPSFSTWSKAYNGGSFMKNHSGYSAYCFSVLNLMKKMPEKENFNPQILHTNDWATVFTINVLKDMSNRNDFYKDIKTLHEVHLASIGTQGKISPFPALLHCFESEEVKKILHNYHFTPQIKTLIKANLPLYSKIKNEMMQPGEKLETFLKDDHNMLKVLSVISDAMISEGDNQIYYPTIKGKGLGQKLDATIRKQFSNVRWDSDNGDFNPSILAIDKSDKWLTVSPNHYKELLKDSTFSSPSMREAFVRNKKKGGGILARIDINRYNPEDPNIVEYPFNKDNAEIQKYKNKSSIAKQLSLKNIKQKNISTRLINNPQSAVIKGHLSNVGKENPLLVSVGRYSSYEKGSDILYDSIAPILDSHPEARVVIVADKSYQYGQQATEKFINNVVNNHKYRGKVVLIDSFEDINSYISGADFFMIPSRTETCCLTQFQAMRMGALPIASPTGGLQDGIVTVEENPKLANGFKAKESMMYSKKPVASYSETVNKALDIFKKDKNLFNKLRDNAIAYKSGWSQSINEHYKIYSKLAKTARKVL